MTLTEPWAPRTDRGDHRTYAVLGAVLAGVVGIAAAFVLSVIVVLLLGGLSGAPSLPVMVVVLFLASAVGMIGTGVAYLSLRGVPILEYVRGRVPGFRDLLWVAGGYVGALGLVFVAGIVLTVLQVQPETSNQAAELGMENPAILLWLVPLSLFVIAPAEEFLFRGVVQGRLREAFAAKVAIPITAALFALIHYTSLTGAAEARLIAIAILFLPSLVFGLAYERTHNIVVPTLIHGLYNSTLVLLVYVTIELLGEAPTPA
jgi:membrane protease YdiL (CAAX protease family)